MRKLLIADGTLGGKGHRADVRRCCQSDGRVLEGRRSMSFSVRGYEG